MKILNTILFLLCYQFVIACSCSNILIDLPLKEMGWTQTETKGISSVSDIVFTGVLLDIREIQEVYQSELYYESNEKKYELIFKLIHSYKGDSNDTIKVRTNISSSACGFWAPLNTECLIFGLRGNNGFYYTFRSDCCKSISKAADKKRYNKYIKFLESLTKMIDGEYVFFQSIAYWQLGYRDTVDTMEVLRYKIKNGVLDGLWQVKDRKGRILEKGEYKNGEKYGIWEVVTYTESDLDEADEQVRVEQIQFKNGVPWESLITIQDNIFAWKEPYQLQVLRKQTIIKKYEYFDIKD